MSMTMFAPSGVLQVPDWIEALMHREVLASFTILGQPCSKANSRQIVTIKGRPTPIKSKDALAYEQAALRQIPPRHRLRLEGRLGMRLRVFYRTELSDLDESLILDILQDRSVLRDGKRIVVQHGVYRNDRQVRMRVVEHGIDRHNPRTEIEVWRLQPAQAPLVKPECTVCHGAGFLPHCSACGEVYVPADDDDHNPLID